MKPLRRAGHTARGGPGSLWRLALVVCVAAVLTASGTAPAAATPGPPPPAASTQPPSPPAGPARPPGPASGQAWADTVQGKEAAQKALTERKKLWAQKDGLRKTLERLGIGHDDLLDSFHITDEHGIPVSTFSVDADSGAWSDWDLKVEAWLTNVLFMAVKWLVAFACWLLTWALGFKLAPLLLKPALTVSDSLYTSVLVQTGMPALFLTFSGITAAWHFFFGQRSRGWGELAASLVISALAATSLASPPQSLLGANGAVGKARDLGVAAAAIVMGGQEPAGTAAGDTLKSITTPITDKLVDAFVVQPAQLLTYGQTFTGTCAARYTTSRIDKAFINQKVAEQSQAMKDLPSGGDVLLPGIGGKIEDFVRDKAGQWALDTFGPQPDEKFEKACVTGDAKAAKKASADKLAGAAFMLLAALLVCALVIALAGGYLAAQVWLAYEAMLLRAALVAGTLPGPGRAWLWSRAASITRGLSLLVVLVVALGVFVVAVTAVVTAKTSDMPGGIMVRFVLVDILCLGALAFRKRLIRASHQAATRVKARLGASKLGGAGAPSGPGTGTGSLRHGALRRAGTAALMLGAMAATGGTAGAAGAGLGRAGSARALTGRLARGAGRLARSAEKTVRAGGRAGLRLGTLSYQATHGLPVYGPRAARRTVMAAQAAQGRATDAAAQLKERLQQTYTTYEGPVRDWLDEYERGTGVRWLVNRHRVRTGRPPIQPRTPSRLQNLFTTPAPAPAGRRAPRQAPPPPATAPQPTRRAQRIPQRPATPPASSQQASLQQRLHRIRTRTRAANPPAPPPAPPRRQPPPPRSPRPRRRP
ncbi:hypothetical protein ACFYWU_40745 [Streptomyces chrestomyceticus]|uniref:hypothetical protein n=1 Tax=Streptomyces chrestomyceticus TaxID=68185 RepID=UPI0036AC9F5A